MILTYQPVGAVPWHLQYFYAFSVKVAAYMIFPDWPMQILILHKCEIPSEVPHRWSSPGSLLLSNCMQYPCDSMSGIRIILCWIHEFKTDVEKKCISLKGKFQRRNNIESRRRCIFSIGVSRRITCPDFPAISAAIMFSYEISRHNPNMKNQMEFFKKVDFGSDYSGAMGCLSGDYRCSICTVQHMQYFTDSQLIPLWSGGKKKNVKRQEVSRINFEI